MQIAQVLLSWGGECDRAGQGNNLNRMKRGLKVEMGAVGLSETKKEGWRWKEGCGIRDWKSEVNEVRSR